MQSVIPVSYTHLYAYMHPCDIVSYDVEVIASYVKATLDMYANVPYAKRVPAELFFTYVLCVRVNNEDCLLYTSSNYDAYGSNGTFARG